MQRDACLASPANAVELIANRRMPFGPDLLSRELKDGRFGNLDDRKYLSQDPVRALIGGSSTQFPFFASTRSHPQLREGAEKQASQNDLRSLLAILTERIEAVESCRDAAAEWVARALMVNRWENISSQGTIKHGHRFFSNFLDFSSFNNV